MIAKKKLFISTVIISSAAILGSCGKSETATELRIVNQCNTSNDLCKFELTNAVVSRYTNLLGKTIERVESQTPLQDIQGTITWNPPAGATLATNTDVVTQLGSGCQNNSCTANANPTAYNLAAGSNAISISGNVTVNGKTVDLATVPPVTVETEQVSDTHVFQRADTPPLPIGQTIQDVVNELNANAASANGTFSVEGNSWKITCNQGYEWLDDQNPNWGGSSRANSTRQVAFLEWTGTAWSSRGLTSRDTFNYGLGGGTRYFIAGCWPVA
ncbi:hypothetical protein FNFX1_0568 [Francisella cf. novicida Fx1]|uniref:DUF3281 family protein n=1 Tax=Francisella tularensis TaxID=263 RepID=UPI0002058963|nr:DUF3281 family protein [Francisella tularensis]AEB27516.1 hypothetical protein FNFX1_0568 [Francisella cf. novicida Fx1]